MNQKFPYYQDRVHKSTNLISFKHRKDEHPSHQGAPRFELGTFRSAVECSTTELYPHILYDIFVWPLIFIKNNCPLLIY